MSSLDADVTIIGGGIGGTAVAALLSHAGLKTILLEKNAVVGGSCSAYSKNGFTVDYGTHLFSRGDSGPLGEVGRRLGEPGLLEFLSLPALMRIRGFGLNTLVPASRFWLLPIVLWTLTQTGCNLRDVAGCVRVLGDILFLSERDLEAADAIDLASYLETRVPNLRLRLLAQMVLGLFFVAPSNRCSAGEAIWCARRLLLEYQMGYPPGRGKHDPRALCGRCAATWGSDLYLGSNRMHPGE